MATPTLSRSYDHFLNFVMEKATPEEILAFKIPESEQERAIELLDKQDEGTLTPEEASELEQMVTINRLVSVLKAKALAMTHRK